LNGLLPAQAGNASASLRLGPFDGPSLYLIMMKLAREPHVSPLGYSQKVGFSTRRQGGDTTHVATAIVLHRPLAAEPPFG